MTIMEGKALVAEELKGDFHLVDIQLDPENLGPDEVIVRFQHTGICHTDLSSWSNDIPCPFPCILGHEGAGYVEYVGPTYAGKFKKDDVVIASFCSCGDCVNCKGNQPANCDLFMATNLGFYTKQLQQVKIPYTKKDGQKKEAFGKYFGQSSFSNRMAVTDRSLTKVKAGTSTKLASTLACGFQTGFSTVLEKAPTLVPRSYDAWQKLGASIPESVQTTAATERSQHTLLIAGMGAVGLGAVYAGKVLGFGSIIATDLSEARLAIAKSAGATFTLNPSGLDQDAFAEKVKEASADKRGASLSIEASGSPIAFKNITNALAISGKVVILGVPPQGSVIDIPTIDVPSHVWTIDGVLMGNSVPEITLPFLVDRIESGDLNFLERMIKVYKPEDMATALQDAKAGNVIKPVIDWS